MYLYVCFGFFLRACFCYYYYYYKICFYIIIIIYNLPYSVSL